ncbi:MAG: AbrB/MazE/SpoVT family DNA-binding domain-containing protein [Geobacteraceae bacterium]|nr:AbrB/MazE/SpoVT family DNA-binding domain-containing protein [Geobacteraceae bacterium]
MKAATCYKTEMRQRGQVTIPKQLRESSGFDEGRSVSIISLGECILMTPKRLDLEEARIEIRKIVRATGMSADKVLAGLNDERQTLFEELYGTKKP